MNLKYHHDFTGKDNYVLPFVLVFQGSEDDLNEVCEFMERARYSPVSHYIGVRSQLTASTCSQTFHFRHRRDMLHCRIAF